MNLVCMTNGANARLAKGGTAYALLNRDGGVTVSAILQSPHCTPLVRLGSYHVLWGYFVTGVRTIIK